VGLPSEITAIGSLADPIRRALYEFVSARPDAVSREAAAEALEITAHQAKFHLERLVDEGLLVTEQRRLTGRTGPGAGRPAKLYRRSAARFQISLPERRYDLAGEILASAIERAARGEQLPEAVDRAARSAAAEHVSGEEPAHRDHGGADAELVAASATLAGIGYEPELADRVVRLRNCPFDPLSRDHTQLICSMNRAYVQGALDASGRTGLRACLEPHAGSCCVSVRAETGL